MNTDSSPFKHELRVISSMQINFTVFLHFSTPNVKGQSRREKGQRIHPLCFLLRGPFIRNGFINFRDSWCAGTRWAHSCRCHPIIQTPLQQFHHDNSCNKIGIQGLIAMSTVTLLGLGDMAKNTIQISFRMLTVSR